MGSGLRWKWTVRPTSWAVHGCPPVPHYSSIASCATLDGGSKVFATGSGRAARRCRGFQAGPCLNSSSVQRRVCIRCAHIVKLEFKRYMTVTSRNFNFVMSASDCSYFFSRSTWNESSNFKCPTCTREFQFRLSGKSSSSCHRQSRQSGLIHTYEASQTLS